MNPIGGTKLPHTAAQVVRQVARGSAAALAPVARGSAKVAGTVGFGIGKVAVDLALAAGVAGGVLGAARLWSRHREFPDEQRSAADTAALERALQRLDQSPTGAPIANYLRQRDPSDVQVLDSATYERRLPPRSAGAYVSRAGRMLLRREFLDDPRRAPLLLAHEGTHMMNDGLGRYVDISLGIVTGSARGAIGVFHGDNPLTGVVDAVHDNLSIKEEIDAYHTDAKVAHELGLRAFGLPTQNPDGTPKSRDEIGDLIRAQPLYQLRGRHRLGVGLGVGAFGALVGADLVTTVAQRLKPGSLPARSRLFNIALLAPVAGALALADMRAHPTVRE